MELKDLMPILVGPVMGFIFGRITKQTDATGDHSVRLAVASERIDRLKEEVGVVKQNQSAVWRAIDSLKANK